MALTCEIMKLDKIYVLYENSGEYFNSYSEAYWHSRISKVKKVNYVFTPTMQLCARVGDLYRTARKYFRENFDCDYLNIYTQEKSTQLKLINEI